MLKLNRLVDYGILITCHLLREEEKGRVLTSAKEISTALHLSQPMVSKILKSLVRSGIVVSERGLKGGYALAPNARRLSLGTLIRALDGPIRLTDCFPDEAASEAGCDLHSLCSVRGTMGRLNAAVQHAFDNVSLAEIARPIPLRGLALPSRDDRPGTGAGAVHGV